MYVLDCSTAVFILAIKTSADDIKVSKKGLHDLDAESDKSQQNIPNLGRG